MEKPEVNSSKAESLSHLERAINIAKTEPQKMGVIVDVLNEIRDEILND